MFVHSDTEHLIEALLSVLLGNLQMELLGNTVVLCLLLTLQMAPLFSMVVVLVYFLTNSTEGFSLHFS